MYVPPFDLYFFATLAMFLLPFAYMVFRSKLILAVFILACCYDTTEFYINQDFWITPAFLACVGFGFLIWEVVKDLGTEEEPDQELVAEEQEPDSRMHPKFKPMRHILPANIIKRVISCLRCGGDNEVPDYAQSAICQYCHKDALSPVW